MAAVFGEFGSIQQIKAYPERGFGFVTFVHRGSAEFAYQAMMDQQLGASQVINIRWAEADPNPGVRAKKHAPDMARKLARRTLAGVRNDRRRGP